jgi:hypothetical protein
MQALAAVQRIVLQGQRDRLAERDIERQVPTRVHDGTRGGAPEVVVFRHRGVAMVLLNESALDRLVDGG